MSKDLIDKISSLQQMNDSQADVIKKLNARLNSITSMYNDYTNKVLDANAALFELREINANLNEKINALSEPKKDQVALECVETSAA